MRETVALLASAIHDAKNQLFSAESSIANLASKHGFDASEVLNAIELASERLTNALIAYRISRENMQPAITAVTVRDLIEDVHSIHHPHILQRGLALDTDCDVMQIWPLDRDLIIDILNNAIQNAGRYAKSRIVLAGRIEGGWLVLRIEDDGPGFPELPSETRSPGTGLGLRIGAQIAALHSRRGRQGTLETSNGGSLGGAVIELRLP